MSDQNPDEPKSKSEVCEHKRPAVKEKRNKIGLKYEEKSKQLVHADLLMTHPSITTNLTPNFGAKRPPKGINKPWAARAEAETHTTRPLLKFGSIYFATYEAR